MKKLIFCLLCFTYLNVGCLKESGCPYTQTNIIAPQSEEQALLSYLNSNGIVASKHNSNLYFEVIQSGSGGYPDLCSEVTVGYTGKLTNGTIFDQQANTVFMLGVLIDGWKKGLPLIQKGGRIKLYIPPTLGYGNVDVKDGSNNIIIPANSILVFDISLMAF